MKLDIYIYELDIKVMFQNKYGNTRRTSNTMMPLKRCISQSQARVNLLLPEAALHILDLSFTWWGPQ